MDISEPLLAKLMTPNTGYTREDIESFGYTWPPAKGWKAELLERLGLRAEYNRICIVARAKSKADKKARKKSARQKRKLAKSVRENREYHAKGLGEQPKPFKPKGGIREVAANAFYRSWEWKKARFETIKKYGAVCMCCGYEGPRIVVDHIKPRSKFPKLELDLSNLQVLCNDCNMGKSNDDYTDFRPVGAELSSADYVELSLVRDAREHE